VEKGMATAEFAAAVPALIIVLVLALSAIETVTDQIRCVDAARATARALARGDGEGAALAVGRRLAPRHATFSVSRSEQEVGVVVRGAPAPALGWLGPRATPSGRAVAAREDVDVDVDVGAARRGEGP
jgi:Flp pilus assembly protein TadG